MKYTPSHIANFFLSKKGHKITNLKLNKIVYISLGYSLHYRNRDLFEEDIEAWKYGPVIPSLYHEFKVFGSGVIQKKSTYLEDNMDNMDIEDVFKINDDEIDNSIRITEPEISKDDKDLNTILEVIFELYDKRTGIALVNLTHQENTPWSISYKNNKQIIPKELIKKYYDMFLAN